MVEDSFKDEKNVLQAFSSFMETKMDEMGTFSSVFINCVIDGRNLLMHLLATQDVDEMELVKKMQFLVHSGISMKHQDNEGSNILFYLITYYKGENLQNQIKFFLEGVDINCKNYSGRNVLHALVLCKIDSTRKVEVMRMLVCYGIEVSTEINTHPEFYEDYFKSNPQSGKLLLQFLALHDSTMSWHLNCDTCKTIL